MKEVFLRIASESLTIAAGLVDYLVPLLRRLPEGGKTLYLLKSNSEIENICSEIKVTCHVVMTLPSEVDLGFFKSLEEMEKHASMVRKYIVVEGQPDLKGWWIKYQSSRITILEKYTLRIINNMACGDHTYHEAKVRVWNRHHSVVKIGKYCSIASNVKFIIDDELDIG